MLARYRRTKFWTVHPILGLVLLLLLAGLQVSLPGAQARTQLLLGQRASLSFRRNANAPVKSAAAKALGRLRQRLAVHLLLKPLMPVNGKKGALQLAGWASWIICNGLPKLERRADVSAACAAAAA